MKKGFKAASIAFYFLMFIVFFFVGIYAAGIFGAGKGQMLAGGAIVLGWGVLFAVIAFVFSFFIVYYIQHKSIVRLNLILLVLLVVLYGITHYRYIERQKEKEKSNSDHPQRKPTQAVPTEQNSIHFKQIDYKQIPEVLKPETTQISESKMGIGFFKPNYFEYPTLYFYGGVNPEKGLLEHLPTDSVVFTRDKYNNPTTKYAPPWLYPEHLKLDYGIIIFKAFGVGHDFIQVESNKQTGQLTNVDKNKGTFITWPEFLLSINSVEFTTNSTKEVFVKPLDYAGKVQVKFSFMQPLFIEEEWMFVRLVNENLTSMGNGWIRWKKENLLLISYSLLS